MDNLNFEDFDIFRVFESKAFISDNYWTFLKFIESNFTFKFSDIKIRIISDIEIIFIIKITINDIDYYLHFLGFIISFTSIFNKQFNLYKIVSSKKDLVYLKLENNIYYLSQYSLYEKCMNKSLKDNFIVNIFNFENNNKFYSKKDFKKQINFILN